MTKRIDFSGKRRAEGRYLAKAAQEIAALIQPVAAQNGIDLQAHLNEASAQKSEEQRLLADRLQESVVPLFVMRRGQPDRIGSCVLVRLDSDFFAFTAAHVIREAASAPLFAPSEGKGGKLLPLPHHTAHLNPSGRENGLDVGVLALAASKLGSFQRRAFLADTEIDGDDRLDDRGLESFYFILGYPASRGQVKVSKAERQIHQQSFHCSTSPVNSAEYLHRGIRTLQSGAELE